MFKPSQLCPAPVLLLANLAACGGHRVALPEVRPPAPVFVPLQEELKKSYLALFETAPKLEYSCIFKIWLWLKQAEDYCTRRFEGIARKYERRAESAQKGLKKTNITVEEPHGLRCTIQAMRGLKSQADVIARHAISVAYDNKQAKPRVDPTSAGMNPRTVVAPARLQRFEPAFAAGRTNTV